MPVSTSQQAGPDVRAPVRIVVRPTSSGEKWWTPSGTPSTPVHTAYTSTGCRLPADIEVRKYVGSSKTGDVLVRVTPAVKNSSRTSVAASSPAGSARRLWPDSTSAAGACDSPSSVGSGVVSRPTYRLKGAGRLDGSRGWKSTSCDRSVGE